MGNKFSVQSNSGCLVWVFWELFFFFFFGKYPLIRNKGIFCKCRAMFWHTIASQCCYILHALLLLLLPLCLHWLFLYLQPCSFTLGSPAFSSPCHVAHTSSVISVKYHNIATTWVTWEGGEGRGSCKAWWGRVYLTNSWQSKTGRTGWLVSTARRRRSGEVARRSLASLFLRPSVYETRRGERATPVLGCLDPVTYPLVWKYRCFEQTQCAELHDMKSAWSGRLWL